MGILREMNRAEIRLHLKRRTATCRCAYCVSAGVTMCNHIECLQHLSDTGEARCEYRDESSCDHAHDPDGRRPCFECAVERADEARKAAKENP